MQRQETRGQGESVTEGGPSEALSSRPLDVGVVGGTELPNIVVGRDTGNTQRDTGLNVHNHTTQKATRKERGVGPVGVCVLSCPPRCDASSCELIDREAPPDARKALGKERRKGNYGCAGRTQPHSLSTAYATRYECLPSVQVIDSPRRNLGV